MPVNPHPIYATLGANVRRYRKRCGLKQAQLGELVGLSAASICNLEKGRQQVYLDTVAAIANALDVDLLVLVP